MKKIHFLLALSMLVLFTSCGKDKTATLADIMGTWNVTQYDSSGTISSTVDDTTTVQEIVVVGKSFDATVTIDDNTFVDEGTITTETTITENGETTTETETDELYLDGTFTFEDGNITLTDADGFTTEFSVVEFSDTEILLEGKQDIEIFFFALIKIDIDLIVRLEK